MFAICSDGPQIPGRSLSGWRKDGYFIKFYPNGMRFESTWHKGKRQGEWKWRSGEQIIMEGQLRHDQLNGSESCSIAKTMSKNAATIKKACWCRGTT